MNSAMDGLPWHRRFRNALAESPALWWSFLYFFCLLSGYYVLRPVRDAMGASSEVEAVFPPAMIRFFAGHGIPLKELILQVLSTCTFILILVAQPVYGVLVSRFPRRVFLPALFGFFIACLFGFYALFHSHIPGRGLLFFLWVTVFNVFSVAVFWSFMADVFSNADAKKYYGYIGAAGTIGAFTGPAITRTLAEKVGLANLMLVSAVFLTACLVCIWRLRHWAIQREQKIGRDNESAMGGDILAGLKLIVKEPLLRWLAAMVFLGVGVGQLLYNQQATIAREGFATAEARTAYYAGIDIAVNVLTLVVQLFITRTLLSRFGLLPVLMIPMAALLLGFAVLTASPLPIIVGIVQVVTRSNEFSLMKPGRETIYTRVDRQWRYKAGAAIDTAFFRGGEITFSWTYKALSAFGSHVVFGVGLLFAGVMTASAWRLLREEKKLPSERGTVEKS
ncbi:NTP/NDP exchange transporter [Pseudoxanthomonas yeongjuensis]|uniref:NTP/NDP exchange transporter n=1 Tax=Pseudoxanthomonas yeongjuensis TaxID=377616 RepID=UPI001B867A8A|nr:MFS transporter [Pseudoxanthomonas yeongjuensis]